ncbi:MAG: GWxTD domain-containing protein [bacterium]|nr:MAG: GWxTD domain-containing protein [bacterium]
MHTIRLIILFFSQLILLQFHFSGAAYPQDPGVHTRRDSLLQKSDSLFRAGDFDKAKKSYENILKLNAYDTLALKQLGRIAFLGEDWGRLKEYCHKISEYDSGNLWAKYYLGIAYRETGKYKASLLRKRDWDKAQDYFDTTLEIDSLYEDILYQNALLLRYREKYPQALFLAHRQIELKPELTVPQVKIFRLYRYFVTYRDEQEIKEWAEQHSWKHAYYALGEKWRRQGEVDKADSLFQKLVQNPAELSTSPLLLSRVRIFTEKGQSKEADSCFWAAVNQIRNQADADLVMEDLKYLLTEEEWQLYLSLYTLSAIKKFMQTFWIKRNPLPANKWNVRLVEHYKRLIEAEKFYEYDGFRTWFMDPDPLNYLEYPPTLKLNEEFNDKGLIYIRHGKPNETAVTVGENIPVNESWLYYQSTFHPRMTFHFIVGKPGNDWRFAPFLTSPSMLEDRLTWGTIYYRLLRADPLEILQFQQEMADLSQASITLALTTDRHSWKEDLKPLDIPLAIHTFRGMNGNTLVELSYQVPPPGKFEKIPHPEKENIRYDIGMVVINRNLNKIIQIHDSLRIPLSQDSAYLDLYRFTLLPDSYLVGFHVEPREVDYLGGYRFRVGIDDYADSTKHLSDIQLATEIRNASDSTKFVKNGLYIRPNPAARFPRESLMYSYVEVYHLTTNADGKSLFSIEYNLTHKNPKKKGFTNLFGLLGGNKSSSISILNERESWGEFSREYIALDVSDLQTGDYQLTITISDEMSGWKDERQTNLTLY